MGDVALVVTAGSRLSQYVGGVENSRLDVPDCHAPLLTLNRYNVAPTRTIDLDVRYIDGATVMFPEAEVRAARKQ